MTNTEIAAEFELYKLGLVDRDQIIHSSLEYYIASLDTVHSALSAALNMRYKRLNIFQYARMLHFNGGQAEIVSAALDFEIESLVPLPIHRTPTVRFEVIELSTEFRFRYEPQAGEHLGQFIIDWCMNYRAEANYLASVRTSRLQDAEYREVLRLTRSELGIITS